MFSLVLTRIGNFSSKMKTKQVLSSSYDDLVNLVAKKYGNNQFRHPNTAALYQIQHHFKIISAGDCILDLGAAPHFRWTELALNLAENEQNTHRVISNDKIECRRPKANHIHIQGNFVEEQIKTKIALALEERKFNAILCDMSPEFTGELEDDAESLASMIQQAFLFGNVFLHKGGHLVCKVLQSAHSDLLQESGKLLFHQTYSYKPSVIRERSPVKFLIFKGYSINHNLEALREFYSRYRGSPKNKVELVNAYKGKYNWDPADMVRRRAKNDILELKMMGRTQRQIENMFKNDPFINIAEIIKQLRLLDKANKEGDQVKLQKAINAFSDGKLYKEAMEIPVTREEWITYIETMEAKLKEAKLKQKKKGNQKPKQSFQPLGDNQVYMRKENVQAQEKQQIVYIKEDLSGDYDLEYERDYIQRQIQKFGHLFRKTKGRLGQGQQYQLGKNVELTQVFKQREEKQEKLRPLSEMAEDLRLMTDEQFKKMTDQQGYDRQIEENVSRPPKGMRNKFKNR